MIDYNLQSLSVLSKAIRIQMGYSQVDITSQPDLELEMGVIYI